MRRVKRCAVWAGKLASEVCGRKVPVHQIIAIPCWTVVPGRFYNPRVVAGGGVAGVLEAITDPKPVAMKAAEIKRIETKLGDLCRDVEW